MPIKKSLQNVFEQLCPRKVSVFEYNITPIPVEILDLIALSKKESYFNKIEIWYDDKNPDPVCVGTTGYYYQPYWHDDRDRNLDGKEFVTEQECKNAGATRVYYNEKQHYLLGRWADVKHSFEELKQMAIDRYISEESNELTKTIRDCQRKLDDIKLTAFDKFN